MKESTAIPEVSPNNDLRVDRGNIETEYKVWIDRRWYARVDKYGHVLGACAEGALGFIIQLYPSSANPDSRAALKVPRLREDSLRQNASVCALLEAEATSVGKLGSSDKLGLIKAKSEDGETLQTLRNLDYAAVLDARRQNRCATFVAFGKTNRIRLCNVGFENNKEGPPKISVFPDSEELTREFSLFLEHPDKWNYLAYLGDDQERPFIRPMYLTIAHKHNQHREGAPPAPIVPKPSDKDSHIKCGPLHTALQPVYSGVTWYTGLPSIVFEWADGTLQHAVTMGYNRDWSAQDRYSLIENVLRGLVKLHKCEIIHGDIRPPNIMAIGDLKQAKLYALGDYGSFLADQPSPHDHISHGHTSAPGVTRHRTSTFYSRERRGGVEREDANVAIIITKEIVLTTILGTSANAEIFDKLPDDEYFIRLDLKQAVVKPETNEIKSDLLKEMANDWISLIHDPGRASSDWHLQENDQVQIRDLVFTVLVVREIKSEKDGRTYFSMRCKRKHNRVLMEKVTVQDDERNLFESSIGYLHEEEHAHSASAFQHHYLPLLMDLPKWIEIRQTSVASDLFSIGVLALYMFYADSVDKKENLSLTDPERALAAIVQRLEDENIFQLIWVKLSSVCERIETALALHKITAEDLLAESSIRGGGTFADDIIELTEELTSNNISPELGKIYSQFINPVHFLFFIHFVLSCIHRRSHVVEKNSEQIYPFCPDRFEQPKNSQSAEKSLHRIEILKRYFDPFIRFFTDFEVALQKRRSEKRINQQLIPASEARQEKERLQSVLEEKNSQLKESEKKIAYLNSKLARSQQLEKENSDLLEKSRLLETERNTLQADGKNLESEKSNLIADKKIVTEKCMQLETKNRQIEVENNQFLKKFELFETEKTRLQANIQALVLEKKSFEEKFKQCEEKIKQAEEANVLLQAKNAANNQREVDIKNLRETKEKLELGKSRDAAKIQELEKDVKNFDKQIENLINERDDIRAKYENLMKLNK